MARARAKQKVEPQVIPSEAREHRLKLGELNDSDVVQASLDGDPRAFGELVRRYDQRLLNFVYRTIGDRERGQDLVQETFLRAHRSGCAHDGRCRDSQDCRYRRYQSATTGSEQLRETLAEFAF